MAQPTDNILDRPLTQRDLDHTPDDGNRYEVIDGVLYVSPFPSYAHQEAAGQLFADEGPRRVETVPGLGRRDGAQQGEQRQAQQLRHDFPFVFPRRSGCLAAGVFIGLFER